MRRRWHGEISITPSFLEYGEFTTHAAANSLRVGIIQCPVAMNESKHRLTVTIIPKQTMTPQCLYTFIEGSAKIVGGVIVMMKMNFIGWKGLTSRKIGLFATSWHKRPSLDAELRGEGKGEQSSGMTRYWISGILMGTCFLKSASAPLHHFLHITVFFAMRK